MVLRLRDTTCSYDVFTVELVLSNTSVHDIDLRLLRETVDQWLAGPSSNQGVAGSIPALVNIVIEQDTFP